MTGYRVAVGFQHETKTKTIRYEEGDTLTAKQFGSLPKGCDRKFLLEAGVLVPIETTEDGDEDGEL